MRTLNTELHTTPTLLMDEHVNGAHDNIVFHDCPLCQQDPEIQPIRHLTMANKEDR